MEEKKNQLFRKKSLESIESPEVLDDYLRVTSPGVWMILGAVILLLVGMIVWGIFGHIDSEVEVAVVSDEKGMYCLVPEEALDAVINHRTVTVKGNELELAPKSIEPMQVEDSMNIYIQMAGNLKPGDVVYPVEVTSELKEGVYTGIIVTETITPIKFLIN